MASIHKLWSGKSPYFFASFMGEDGRFKLRSTKQTDPSKAMTIALEYERVASQARAGTLTEAQCRKVLSDILERTTGDTIRHVATESFFKDWLRDKETAKSTATALRYQGVVNKFLAHLGDKAKKPINAISTRDIQSFLNFRLKSGRATKTVAVDKKSLAAVFNAARRQGIIAVNPVEATESIEVESHTREVFTAVEVRLLLESAPTTDWKTCILLGYYTGARLSDCAAMKWDNVNLTESLLTFQQQKTNVKVVVPLHPDLERHLSKLASTDKPEIYLCPSLAGRDTGGAHGLSQGFKAIMAAAGIDARQVEGMGNHTFSKRTFHSLRHSFNSALANADVAPEVRQKLTGHTSAEVNKLYTHQERETLARAIKKLPSLLGVKCRK